MWVNVANGRRYSTFYRRNGLFENKNHSPCFRRSKNVANTFMEVSGFWYHSSFIRYHRQWRECSIGHEASNLLFDNNDKLTTVFVVTTRQSYILYFTKGVFIFRLSYPFQSFVYSVWHAESPTLLTRLRSSYVASPMKKISGLNFCSPIADKRLWLSRRWHARWLMHYVFRSQISQGAAIMAALSKESSVESLISCTVAGLLQ